MKTKINKPLNPKNIVAAKPGSIKIDKSSPLTYTEEDPVVKYKAVKNWYDVEAEDFTE